jgi:hypothetical protein
LSQAGSQLNQVVKRPIVDRGHFNHGRWPWPRVATKRRGSANPSLDPCSGIAASTRLVVDRAGGSLRSSARRFAGVLFACYRFRSASSSATFSAFSASA